MGGTGSSQRELIQIHHTYQEAARHARAFAVRYGQTVDVKTVADGVAVLVAASALRQWDEDGRPPLLQGTPAAPTKGTASSGQVARLTRPVRREASVPSGRDMDPTDRPGPEGREGIAAAQHPAECVGRTSGEARVSDPVIYVDSSGVAGIRAQPRNPAAGSARRLVSELQQAYAAAPSDLMTDWAMASVARLGTSLTRRVGNLGGTIFNLLRGVSDEAKNFMRAAHEGTAVAHLKQRAAAAGQSTTDYLAAVRNQSFLLIRALQRDPSGVGIELAVAALAFYCAGGGLDGDGGVPDTDIALFGIGGHRSIFTHSVLSGAVVEASIFSLYDFLRRAHGYLPPDHDPVWDKINSGLKRITSPAVIGSGVGIAYHLGVDASVQPAAYHDLPFSAPLHVHQEIMGANAAAEGLDVAHKPDVASMSQQGHKQKRSKDDVLSRVGAGLAAIAALILVDIGLS